MENASKALIMSVEILVGVMIISLCVYLFNLYSNYSEETYERIESTQIAQFNNNFLKFQGSNKFKKDEKNVEVPIACTIHDIVGIANFAQKHNLENELLIPDTDGRFKSNVPNLDNTIYVSINVEFDKPHYKITNLETKSLEDLTKLVKTYDLEEIEDLDTKLISTRIRYFKCECDINEESGRVQNVTFTEFDDKYYDYM